MQKKAKTILLQLDLFSPDKRMSVNDINSWNETHDKKIKFKWTSSKKKVNKKAVSPIKQINLMKKKLEMNVEKNTPSTGRSTQVRKLEYQLINTKNNISEFMLPDFDKQTKKQILKTKSTNNKINTRSNWSRSARIAEKVKTKEMIQRQIRQHLQDLKKPIVTRKIPSNNGFLALISKPIK